MYVKKINIECKFIGSLNKKYLMNVNIFYLFKVKLF